MRIPGFLGSDLAYFGARRSRRFNCSLSSVAPCLGGVLSDIEFRISNVLRNSDFALRIYPLLLCLCFAGYANAATTTPVIPAVAHPLPLSAVHLTGGPLKHAQDLDAEYLLKLEPDRMLYYLRKRAGLEPKGERGYGGWDGDGRQLTGHICGHYLSAVSLMWEATGDTRFKDRADYIVAQLKEIQDKHGDGYIGALMGNLRQPGQSRSQTNALADGKTLFGQLSDGVILSGGFDLNGMWSPWYVQHKLYAGLRDAYRCTGNRTALDVEVKFAEWADGILSKLSPAQIQQMLATEFGGMNEMMVDLYADTGDARWLKAADYFEHNAIIEPLARHQDILAGKHGNTQVPKLLGSLERYIYTGEAREGYAAGFFWDTVVAHHTFATGGHGRNEYFGQPDKLNDMVDGRTAETCNVYNMLKMTRALFALWPDAHYADFQERALFNHILGSIDPESGSTCYMVCVGQSPRQREYADMFGSFTCCVGTGMESHALHGDGIYYTSSDKLWVNIYAPSTAEWKEMGLKLEMQTDFPEGEKAMLKLTGAPTKEFTIALRRPFWAREGFAVKINGETAALEQERPMTGPGGSRRSRPELAQTVSTFVELQRQWKDGDTIEVALPKSLRLEKLPDNPNRAAILWGPLVLAGDLGPEQSFERRRGRGASTNDEAAPVFVTSGKPLNEWIKPVDGKPGWFRTAGAGRDRDVDLKPFYSVQHRAYAVYWNFFTPEEWDKKQAQHLADRESARQLEQATVAYAQPGEMQPERDYNYQGEASVPVRKLERAGRRGSKWFSFDLPVESGRPMTLRVTYLNDEEMTRSFDVLCEGKRIGQQRFDRRSPEQVTKFFDVDYAIPADLITGKQKVTVRFEATDGNETGAVFGVRMLRTGALK